MSNRRGNLSATGAQGNRGGPGFGLYRGVRNPWDPEDVAWHADHPHDNSAVVHFPLKRRLPTLHTPIHEFPELWLQRFQPHISYEIDKWCLEVGYIDPYLAELYDMRGVHWVWNGPMDKRKGNAYPVLWETITLADGKRDRKYKSVKRDICRMFWDIPPDLGDRQRPVEGLRVLVRGGRTIEQPDYVVNVTGEWFVDQLCGLQHCVHPYHMRPLCRLDGYVHPSRK